MTNCGKNTIIHRGFSFFISILILTTNLSDEMYYYLVRIGGYFHRNSKQIHSLNWASNEWKHKYIERNLAVIVPPE